LFPLESHFAIPGNVGINNPFPGKSRDPGNDFFKIKLEIGRFLKLFWLTQYGAPRSVLSCAESEFELLSGNLYFATPLLFLFVLRRSQVCMQLPWLTR
jgi:hypothetical protein